MCSRSPLQRFWVPVSRLAFIRCTSKDSQERLSFDVLLRFPGEVSEKGGYTVSRIVIIAHRDTYRTALFLNCLNVVYSIRYCCL